MIITRLTKLFSCLDKCMKPSVKVVCLLNILNYGAYSKNIKKRTEGNPETPKRIKQITGCVAIKR